MLKETLHIGKVRPHKRFVGKEALPTKRKDKFGALEPGEVRIAKIGTKYGTLYPPIAFIGKNVKITMEEK